MNDKFAIIGLGYVGINLALEFGKKTPTIGFDINSQRIQELKKYIDRNKEFSKNEILKSKYLQLTSNFLDLENCKNFIITVPTPIYKNKKPDLRSLKNATKLISKFIKKGSIIIYESTVFPGCTEEFCVPIIEKYSNKTYKKDFNCAYSPERVNPGDKVNKFNKINKIIGASSKSTLNKVYNLYKIILGNNLVKVSSIKVAEASKVIENIQRDLNIALINELAVIFNKLGLNSKEIIDAASTKWNFNKYHPGLVGGHCIGIDPYYLTYKSKQIGYNPKVILAGRKMNESMPNYVMKLLITEAKLKNISISQKNILIVGYTFKENCSDIRNTKVKNLYDIAKKIFKRVDIYDPVAYIDSNFEKKNFTNLNNNKIKYSFIIFAVAHDFFKDLGINFFIKHLNKDNIILDLKSTFPKYKNSIKL